MAKKSLAGITILSGLDDQEREKLEEICNWRRCRAGDRIFDHGSDDRDVYFLVDGTVRMVSFAPSGRELTFAAAEAGAMFGELAAIAEQPRSNAVVANTDCLLAILEPEPFVELLLNHGEISYQLLRRLAVMVRQGTEQMIELNSLDATERIYKALLEMAQPHKSVSKLWVIEPLPPLREIARRVHADPAQVVNVMNQLYPSGLLRREGESLYLMDLSTLKELISSIKTGEAPEQPESKTD